jgi:hypothetical protein
VYRFHLKSEMSPISETLGFKLQQDYGQYPETQ